MTDCEIIRLFQIRNEAALQEAQSKYGGYCRTIAQNILNNADDAEECTNDTLLKAWNAIPPAEPKSLSAFLARVTRNTAIDYYEKRNAVKRGGGQMTVVLSEIEVLTGADNTIDRVFDSRTFSDVMNQFLSELPKQQRIILLRRYLYFYGIGEIASDLGISESKVKSLLFRLRKKLRGRLVKEDILS